MTQRRNTWRSKNRGGRGSTPTASGINPNGDDYVPFSESAGYRTWPSETQSWPRCAMPRHVITSTLCHTYLMLLTDVLNSLISRGHNYDGTIVLCCCPTIQTHNAFVPLVFYPTATNRCIVFTALACRTSSRCCVRCHSGRTFCLQYQYKDIQSQNTYQLPSTRLIKSLMLYTLTATCFDHLQAVWKQKNHYISKHDFMRVLIYFYVFKRPEDGWNM
jgi:hypothetical protein